MPYFFVDGTQGGKPTLAFYVEADNAEAALARAAHLGMVGTGVRPAADAADEGVILKLLSKNFYFMLYLFPAMVMFMALDNLFTKERQLAWMGTLPLFSITTFMLATAIAILFRLILHSIQVRQRLEVEVRELRQLVESQHAAVSGR